MKTLKDFNSRMVHDGRRNNREVEIICEMCGGKAWQRWGQVKQKLQEGKHFFCSLDCAYDWRRSIKPKILGKENANFVFDITRGAWYAYWKEEINGKYKQTTTTKARWLWKMNYGDIPKGYVVTYKDRNPENCELDNLELVTRGERTSEALMGHFVSEETKQKLSDAHSGKILTKEHKKNIGLATKKMWEDGVFDAPYIREIYAKQGRFTRGSKWTKEQRKAHSELMKGKDISWLHTPEVREKAAKAKRGKSQSPESNKKRSETLKGREFTEEHRKNLSIANQKRDDLKGENSRWWKGGVSEQLYPPEFNVYLKQKIRRRDNHQCQCCGDGVYRSKRGHVHHIDANKQNCSENNLVLTCVTCHNAIHGRNNLTSEKIEYYRDLLKH